MYEGLVHAHSGLRWVVLLGGIYAIMVAYKAWKGNQAFVGSVKSAGTIFLSSLHLQFVLGLILYFMSPWFQALKDDASAVMGNSVARFYAVEHISMMLVAVIIATIGSAKSKRKADAAAKSKTRFIWFLIAMVIILISIPWPMRFENAGWF
ncbi:MAG: cytochrome B [Bacteroidetes bacterium]|nr:MAG: cytochrome B [Bacteroidota bacterium]